MFNNYNKKSHNHNSFENSADINKNLNNNRHEEIYTLSYFLTKNIDTYAPKEEQEKIKAENRNKNKVKKLMLPLLVAVVENKDFIVRDKEHSNNNESQFKKDFEVILKNKFNKLSKEYQYYFITGSYLDKQKEVNIKIIEDELTKTIDTAFKEAAKFLVSFRNIMIHKNIQENSFSRFYFNKFKGVLFRLLEILLKSELDKNEKYKKEAENKNLSIEKFNFKEEYITKVLNIDLQARAENIPFIFALSILAMFVEKREMKEVLDAVKLHMFIENFILSFSLRGGYKTFVPGIVFNDNELYSNQLKKKEFVNKDISNSSRRLKKGIGYFGLRNINNNIEEFNDIKEFNNYKNILRLYEYKNSFPKIEELEILIREYKAQELAKSNEAKMEGVQQQRQNAYKNNLRVMREGKGVKLQIKNELKLETDYNKLIPELTNVFRNNDIFIKECINFLYSKYKGEFGNNTWSISGNAVIWLEPNEEKDICFDIRRKISPSKNGLNSLYKIVYNKENADKFSINKHNLRSLMTFILINDMSDDDFKKLKETASNSYESLKKEKIKSVSNDKTLADILKEKSKSWKTYKQISFILQVIKKAIIKNKHLHCKQNVAFHKDFMVLLYLLDSKDGNIYNEAIELIEKNDIDTNIPKEVENILKSDSLSEMLDKSFSLFKTKIKKEDKKSNFTFKTWSKFAFMPYNEKNCKISDILKWDSVRKEYGVKNKTADLFDIWINVFEKNNYKNIPPIVKLYNKYIKTTKINKYRNKEIRNIIVEEMILSYLSFIYLKRSHRETDFFTLESCNDNNIDNNYTPLQFDLVWKLEPEIRINIKDYNKKTVRNALNWIFNASRIKRHEVLNEFKGTKEDLQECLNAVIKAYRVIKTDNVLKKRSPQIEYYINYEVLTADNIKDILRVLRWFQKEMLYFICNIEENITFIYRYFKINNISIKKDEVAGRTGGYFDFPNLIDFYNENLEIIKNIGNYKYNDPIPEEIKICRIMLSHGRMFDSLNKIDYYKLIRIINASTLAVFGRSLRCIYNNIRIDFYSRFNSIREYEDKRKFMNLINEAKSNSKNDDKENFINSINIKEIKQGESTVFSLEYSNLSDNLYNSLINLTECKLKENQKDKKDLEITEHCNLLLRTNLNIIKQNNNSFPMLFLLILIKDYVNSEKLDNLLNALRMKIVYNFFN